MVGVLAEFEAGVELLEVGAAGVELLDEDGAAGVELVGAGVLLA
ncbi:MAG: hypothetical protein AMXMBFR33_69860 [Candidatus Xenobia bacterium]